MKKKVLSGVFLLIIITLLFTLASKVWAVSLFDGERDGDDIEEIVGSCHGSDFDLLDPCEGFEAINGSEIYCGEIRGAGYRIEVPANWNGDLVMWAHGYRLFDNEGVYVDNPPLWVDDPPIRTWLIENGYAWAASSYRANDLNLSVGVDDTWKLTWFFKRHIAQPDHIYVMGESMGGGIAVILIEHFPRLYDGALVASGLLSPYEALDIWWDYYVVASELAGFEATYPIPEDFVSSGDYDAIKEALAGAPELFPYELNTQGEQLKSVMKYRTGGERPVYDQGFNLWLGFMDLLWTFPAIQLLSEYEIPGVWGVWLDNWNTIYQFDSDPALSPEEQTLNDSVFRVKRNPWLMIPFRLRNIPITTGRIKVPVLTLHSLGDIFVPFSQVQIYANKVESWGAADLLVNRAIREMIHSTIGMTEEEITTGFSDLVNWVETGVKPPEDNVLDPTVVANPNFGCQFTTTGGHDYTGYEDFGFIIPPCP